jgi:hypothetical protein
MAYKLAPDWESPDVTTADYEAPCPDGCGYMIYPGDQITRCVDGYARVLLEHPDH